jgi:hypothetical protein
MPTNTFKCVIAIKGLDEFLVALPPGCTAAHRQGASVARMNGNVCTGYDDGSTAGSVSHAAIEVTWDGPTLKWYDFFRDLPMCEDTFQVIPQRWMNGPSSVVDDSVYRLLHSLAYTHRRPGDRVMVPVDQVYGIALSLGAYVPKGNGHESTADRVQPLLFNPYVSRLPAPAPMPAIHGDTEFHNNLRLIASYPFCHPRDIPMVCAAMTLAGECKSSFVGEIKKRGEFNFTVDKIFGPFTGGDYGDTFKVVMSDDAGDRVIWWTSTDPLEKQQLELGKSYKVAATPTKHDSDDGFATTFVSRLSRCDLKKTRKKGEPDADAAD